MKLTHHLIPYLSQLKRIVEKSKHLSEEAERLDSLYQYKPDKLEHLKQGLLKRAFEKNCEAEL
ncbi:MAG: hypothetical protein IPM85_18495 [Chitinophagaceae bacterium]|nr:hypothetical protein [Chitinophagaceae bacterium]